MRHLYLTTVLVAAALGCASDSPGPSDGNPPPGGQQWKAFEFNDLVAQQQASAAPFFEFLDEPSMSMGLYNLPVGGIDNQSAHLLDEVYYVVEGTATLLVDGQNEPIQPGKVVYVKAGVDHEFQSITAELKALVIFSKTTPTFTGANWLAWDLADLVAPRNSSQNVFNLFLDAATLQVGMYMLPQGVGGDATLVHGFDEVNIVVDGGATFRMGSDEIDIQPGTIMFVEDGVGHTFQSLTADVDVLIFWEKRN